MLLHVKEATNLTINKVFFKKNFFEILRIDKNCIKGVGTKKFCEEIFFIKKKTENRWLGNSKVSKTIGHIVRKGKYKKTY